MQARPGLWRQTPPAIFPPILGLYGAVLGWRLAAGQGGGALAGPAETALGMVSALYAFALLAYLAKVMRRPATVIADFGTLPGRLGLSTMSMSLMLAGQGVLVYRPGAALALLWLGLGVHLALILAMAWRLATSPAEARRPAPDWHLVFVGPIVAPAALLRLGLTTPAGVIFALTLAAAAVIGALSAVDLARRTVPAPLRPLLAIHLSPVSLLAGVALLLGHRGLGVALALLALILLAVLLARLPWLIGAGFSPFWGAFTFPLSAFAGMLLIVGEAAPAARFASAPALAAATVVSAAVAVAVLRRWARGELAARTAAARA